MLKRISFSLLWICLLVTSFEFLLCWKSHSLPTFCKPLRIWRHRPLSNPFFSKQTVQTHWCIYIPHCYICAKLSLKPKFQTKPKILTEMTQNGFAIPQVQCWSTPVTPPLPKGPSTEQRGCRSSQELCRFCDGSDGRCLQGVLCCPAGTWKDGGRQRLAFKNKRGLYLDDNEYIQVLFPHLLTPLIFCF